MKPDSSLKLWVLVNTPLLMAIAIWRPDWWLIPVYYAGVLVRIAFNKFS